MNLLVLDTSTDRAAIGLMRGADSIESALTEPARQHGRDLIPRIRDFLVAAGLVPSDIDVVAAGIGPGSYTGLRVGLMAAKTFAYATGASVLGLDSLEAVARNAPRSAGRISVIADAQRENVYVADFYRVAAGDPLAVSRRSRIESLSDWRASLEPGTLVIGPGLANGKIRAAAPADMLAGDSTLDYPQATSLIELARDVWAAGRRDDLWQLEPRYLRGSAAEEKCVTGS
jgi:tRNA threonylcarbamoyladenosine biosynthesis protein TsaB